jgi:hypothetical protein
MSRARGLVQQPGCSRNERSPSSEFLTDQIQSGSHRANDHTRSPPPREDRSRQGPTARLLLPGGVEIRFRSNRHPLGDCPSSIVHAYPLLRRDMTRVGDIVAMPYIVSGRVKLYFEENGCGYPIIFLHEFEADSRALDRPALPAPYRLGEVPLRNKLSTSDGHHQQVSVSVVAPPGFEPARRTIQASEIAHERQFLADFRDPA